ncbi:MAG: 50S ribosomal protein L32 [Phycisphaerales bacterium]|nr:50S ribosomal protein L32 [Phycisphaerales bacterium]
MMLPCQRKSRSQSKMRRSHQALKPIASVRCPNCGSAKLPHAACSECGYVRPGLKLKIAQEA